MYCICIFIQINLLILSSNEQIAKQTTEIIMIKKAIKFFSAKIIIILLGILYPSSENSLLILNNKLPKIKSTFLILSEVFN